MLSFVLLGALFTLGQCGGSPDAGPLGDGLKVDGTGGPDPTPKPTEPPKYANTGCGHFEVGVCDVATTDMIYSSTGPEHTTEPTCAQYCTDQAAEYGDGCCQLGGCVDNWSGRQCGAICQFYEGSQPTDTPQTDYGTTEYRGSKFKRTYCTASDEADEAMSFFAQTSDESGLVLARNFCAAVGLVTTLYGAYRYYFGSKN